MAKTTTTTKKAVATPKKATATKAPVAKKLSSKEILAMLKEKYDEVFDDGGVYSIKKGASGALQMPKAKLRLNQHILV